MLSLLLVPFESNLVCGIFGVKMQTLNGLTKCFRSCYFLYISIYIFLSLYIYVSRYGGKIFSKFAFRAHRKSQRRNDIYNLNVNFGHFPDFPVDDSKDACWVRVAFICFVVLPVSGNGRVAFVGVINHGT